MNQLAYERVNDVYPGIDFYPEVREKKAPKYNVKQKYSVIMYIMFFFSFAIMGWLWEVCLHLVNTGAFVNRGTMLGPWLPIYGVGGAAAVLLFKRFSDNRLLTFFIVMISCTVLEYATSWVLEAVWGMKWWDYSHIMFNINGRVCLLGAVTFGLGGSAAIYAVAPFFNELYGKIPKKWLTVIACTLAAIFVCDAIYSGFHPNIGKGITDLNAYAAPVLYAAMILFLRV